MDVYLDIDLYIVHASSSFSVDIIVADTETEKNATTLFKNKTKQNILVHCQEGLHCFGVSRDLLVLIYSVL